MLISGKFLKYSFRRFYFKSASCLQVEEVCMYVCMYMSVYLFSKVTSTLNSFFLCFAGNKFVIPCEDFTFLVCCKEWVERDTEIGH